MNIKITTDMVRREVFSFLPNKLQVAARPKEQITENIQQAYSPERTMKQTNKPNRRSKKKQRAKPTPNLMMEIHV